MQCVIAIGNHNPKIVRYGEVESGVFLGVNTSDATKLFDRLLETENRSNMEKLMMCQMMYIE